MCYVESTMKTIPVLLMGLAIPVYAGTPAMESAAPASEPCDFTWFAGASIGYLTELEEPMYNFHLGTDTCWNLGGWDVSFFLEVGYAEKDDSWTNVPRGVIVETDVRAILLPPPPSSFDLDELEDGLSNLSFLGGGDTSYDLDIMPITLNVKLERPLTGNLNAYLGGGLGLAQVDLSVNGGAWGDLSDDDWVFTGQLFAGVNYNFNPNFEVYGGARWIYYDDADIEQTTFEVDDDFLFELGARFNF